MNKESLINACIEMVTKNGRPFSIMEHSGFRKVIDPVINALNKKKEKMKITINEENLKKIVTEKAITIRDKLGKEFENKMISLKIDIATRLDRSFLGINIQYVDSPNNQIVLNTLGVIELHERHTGEHLRVVLTEVLQKYNIKWNKFTPLRLIMVEI